jgi:hypothetical protein
VPLPGAAHLPLASMTPAPTGAIVGGHEVLTRAGDGPYEAGHYCTSSQSHPGPALCRLPWRFARRRAQQAGRAPLAILCVFSLASIRKTVSVPR